MPPYRYHYLSTTGCGRIPVAGNRHIFLQRKIERVCERSIQRPAPKSQRALALWLRWKRHRLPVLIVGCLQNGISGSACRVGISHGEALPIIVELQRGRSIAPDLETTCSRHAIRHQQEAFKFLKRDVSSGSSFPVKRICQRVAVINGVLLVILHREGRIAARHPRHGKGHWRIRHGKLPIGNYRIRSLPPRELIARKHRSVCINAHRMAITKVPASGNAGGVASIPLE